MGLFLSLFLHGAVDNELGALSPTEGRLNRPRAIYIADGLPPATKPGNGQSGSPAP
nr:MAG TPA: hypothetical protein [Caudoviricetes sp.]